jgi:hypothetical protein
VTHHRGVSPVESSDGQWLYYAKTDPYATWRLPLTHENAAALSSEQMVLGPLEELVMSSWTLAPSELLFFLRDPSGQSYDIRG